MLDVEFIRQNPKKVKENILKRGFDPKKADIDRFLELDRKRRKLIAESNKLRGEKNKISKLLGIKDKKEIIQKGKEIKTKLEMVEKELNEITEEWQTILDWIPNMALEDVPEGSDERNNVEIKAWIPGKGYVDKNHLRGPDGSKAVMPKRAVHGDKEFKPKPHWEIGKELDLIDIEAGSKVSGSRFYYLKNEAVLIMNAIYDILTRKLLKEGFIPMNVPILVKERVLYGTSHFPADADQVYRLDITNVEDKGRLFLVGSSEPSLFGYWMDKVVNVTKLPIKMMALSTCLRSEAGSWGKDVRGIKRAHQFDKLEMDMIIENDLEKAKEAHEYLLSINEWLLQQLELPYHVINMCTGDLGYAASAKKYDYEIWVPSQECFVEAGSNSITTDFQSRRLNIKYRDKDGKIRYAYTLNDTGATHRLLIGILDHYQQADGSVIVPKVLREYVGKGVIKKGY